MKTFMQELEEQKTKQPVDHVGEGKMVLRAENLVKRYGKRTVVNHVS